MAMQGRKKDVTRRNDAYEMYRKCRNLNQVAKELGTPIVTLSRWKKEEDWDTRINEFQDKLEKHINLLEEAKTDVLVRQDVVELDVLKHLESIVSKKIVDGSLEPQTWKDVLDTMKYIDNQRRLLTGKPTSRVATSEVSQVQQLDGAGRVDKEELKKLRRITETSSTASKEFNDD